MQKKDLCSVWSAVIDQMCQGFWFIMAEWKEVHSSSPARAPKKQLAVEQPSAGECFLVVQPLSHIWLFATPWTAVCQTSLSFTISWSLLKLMSIQFVMSSNHLILCHHLLLLPSVFPSIRVFSKKSALRITWPKYLSFTWSINLTNDYSGLISFRID